MVSDIQLYIDQVRSGKIKVCKEQLLLCDFVEKAFDTENIRVDEAQLARYLNLQKYFPFSLLPWEKFCFALHNCTYKADGQLRWPFLFVLVGRGSGKNGFIAFEDFCLLTPINGVKNYHVDIFATSEDQARTSFDDVREVLEEHRQKLEKHFAWNMECITNKSTGSKLRFRTSGFKTKDGGRPGKVDFDEFHAYENWKMVDVATTGLGKKAFPRRTVITTDGDVRDGPLDQLKSQATQILQGDIEDNGMIPFICRLDSADEVNEKSNWTKSNPSLQYFPVLLQEMEVEYANYVLDPIGNSSFMTKRMNLPAVHKDAEVTSWDNIKATSQPLPDLDGCSCVAGIDYARTTDFVAAGLLFKKSGKYIWIPHTWVCAQCPDLVRIKAPLKEWEARGLLTFVDGVEVPPSVPAQWLEEQSKHYDITTLGMDTYRYTLLARALSDVGFDTEKGGKNNVRLIRKSTQMLYAPTINSAFANHDVVWGDNPLMRWYTNNACIATTKDGNMTYEKIEPKSRKTDGFMAFVAAMCISEDLTDCDEDVDFDFSVYSY